MVSIFPLWTFHFYVAKINIPAAFAYGVYLSQLINVSGFVVFIMVSLI